MEDSTRRNDTDGAGPASGFSSTWTAIIGVLVAGCCLVAIAAVVVLSVIPLYLSQQGTDFSINSASTARVFKLAFITNYASPTTASITNLASLAQQINTKLGYKSNILGVQSAIINTGANKKKRQTSLSCNTLVNGLVTSTSSGSAMAITLILNRCPKSSCATDYCVSNCLYDVKLKLASVLGLASNSFTIQTVDGRTVTISALLCSFTDIAAQSCSDGIKNGIETDKDCGGTTCLAQNKTCATGLNCLIGRDCTSGVCTNSICQASTCSDSVKNGVETDTDCGGTTCIAQGKTCANGLMCSNRSDCTSDVCTNGICVAAPACSDRTTCCSTTLCNPCTAFGVTFYCKKVVNTLGSIAGPPAVAAAAGNNPTGTGVVAAPTAPAAALAAGSGTGPDDPAAGPGSTATPVYLYINSTCPTVGPILAPGNAAAGATDTAAALAASFVVAVAAGTNPNSAALPAATYPGTAAANNITLNLPYITTVGSLNGFASPAYPVSVVGGATGGTAATNYPASLVAAAAGANAVRRVAGNGANPSVAGASTATGIADVFNNAGTAAVDGIPDTFDLLLAATLAGPNSGTVYRGLTLTTLGAATGTGAIITGTPATGAGATFPTGAGAATGFGAGPNCVPNL